MGAVFRREFGSFFTSSIAYVFLAAFYLISGFFFYEQTLASGTSDMSGFFYSILIIVALLIPVLTMKSFSEEKRQKTEQGLLTAPISLTGMVLGKYFAVLLMFIIGISITLVYACILSFFGTVDWLMIMSNYMALVLAGAAFIAVGVFISSLTENQMVAAVGGIISLLFLSMLDLIARLIDIDYISDVLNALAFYNKYNEFTVGIFNLSSVLFYISAAVIFNFLTVRVFEKRRWS